MISLSEQPPDDEALNWSSDYQVSTSERPVRSFEIPRDLTRRMNTEKFPTGATRYGMKALKAEAETVAKTGEGARNVTLWSSGCSVGQLVGGGEIDLGFALSQLRGAARFAGLSEEEIDRVLVRPGGALETGIVEPRNRFGPLVQQYESKILSPASFNQDLQILESTDFWHRALSPEAPGFQCLRLQWQIEQLVTIYWANYLYFLNEVHLLALSRAKGTKRIYELLNRQFLAQASEWEERFVTIDFGLLSVIANAPPLWFGFSGEIHDARRVAEGAS